MTKALADVAMSILVKEKTHRQPLWNAALQRLRKSDLIFNEKADIELIVDDTIEMYREAHEERIKDELFRLVWPYIAKDLVRGCGNWYTDLLATPSAPAAPPATPEVGVPVITTPQLWTSEDMGDFDRYDLGECGA